MQTTSAKIISWLQTVFKINMKSQSLNPDRSANILISNRSFGTKVLNGRKYNDASSLGMQPQFELIPMDREALLRARDKQDEFLIMQDPSNCRLIVFNACDDSLIEAFIGIYAPASPDCIFPDAGSPVKTYFYAKINGAFTGK